MGKNRKTHEQVIDTSNGDEVEALFLSNAPAIRSFCRRLLSDPALADDAVQQTFEIVLKSIGSLRNTDHSRAWIFQIARNECYRLLKQPQLPEFTEEHAADFTPTPLHLMMESDLRAIIRSAIDQLPHIYREAVLLRDMEGFTYAEIAGITQVPVSAVKFRIFKGRELLMENLRPVQQEWRMP